MCFRALLRWRARSRKNVTRDWRLYRRWPAREFLLRDYAHRIRDGNVRNALRVGDPAHAIELTHFLLMESGRVGGGIRLKPRLWILRQGQAQGVVDHRSRIKPQNDQRQNKHRHQHQRRAGPDKASVDIGRLMSSGAKRLLRHSPIFLSASLANPARAARTPTLFQLCRPSPAHRPY